MIIDEYFSFYNHETKTMHDSVCNYSGYINVSPLLAQLGTNLLKGEKFKVFVEIFVRGNSDRGNRICGQSN